MAILVVVISSFNLVLWNFLLWLDFNTLPVQESHTSAVILMKLIRFYFLGWHEKHSISSDMPQIINPISWEPVKLGDFQLMLHQIINCWNHSCIKLLIENAAMSQSFTRCCRSINYNWERNLFATIGLLFPISQVIISRQSHGRLIYANNKVLVD